jgi:hypothetical protein
MASEKGQKKIVRFVGEEGFFLRVNRDLEGRNSGRRGGEGEKERERKERFCLERQRQNARFPLRSSPRFQFENLSSLSTTPAVNLTNSFSFSLFAIWCVCVFSVKFFFFLLPLQLPPPLPLFQSFFFFPTHCQRRKIESLLSASKLVFFRLAFPPPLSRQCAQDNASSDHAWMMVVVWYGFKFFFLVWFYVKPF